MRMKYVKTGICQRPNEFYKKKFYEYSLHTKEELRNMTKQYTDFVGDIVERSKKNWKANAIQIQPIQIPRPTESDIDDIRRHHLDKKHDIIGIVKKNNNNIQIYIAEQSEDLGISPSSKNSNKLSK